MLAGDQFPRHVGVRKAPTQEAGGECDPGADRERFRCLPLGRLDVLVPAGRAVRVRSVGGNDGPWLINVNFCLYVDSLVSTSLDLAARPITPLRSRSAGLARRCRSRRALTRAAEVFMSAAVRNVPPSEATRPPYRSSRPRPGLPSHKPRDRQHGLAAAQRRLQDSHLPFLADLAAREPQGCPGCGH
jgi:hypothetical protein